MAVYLGLEKQRRDAEIYTAGRTVISTYDCLGYDRLGSSGRRQALEFLNAFPGTGARFLGVVQKINTEDVQNRLHLFHLAPDAVRLHIPSLRLA